MALHSVAICVCWMCHSDGREIKKQQQAVGWDKQARLIRNSSWLSASVSHMEIGRFPPYTHPDSIRAESIPVCVFHPVSNAKSGHTRCQRGYIVYENKKRHVSCVALQHSTLMVRTICTQREKKRKNRGIRYRHQGHQGITVKDKFSGEV